MVYIISLLLIVLCFLPLTLSAQAGSINEGNLNDDPVFKVDTNEKYEEYLKSEGKIIKKISIRILDVSGPSVDEQNGSDTSWLGQIGNALHFETREWVVRNALLFSEGDAIDAVELSESERLLRSAGYFLDARITIESKEEDSAVVVVTTKDMWTLTFLISYDTKNKNSYFGFRDDNIIGLGHKLDAALTHDEDKSIGLGGTLRYYAMNIAGSYINAGTELEANRNFTSKMLNFSRPFVTNLLEAAGGFSFKWENGYFNYFDNNGNFISLPYKFNMQDFWLGKSYTPFFGSKLFKKNTRIVTSARVSRLNHYERPLVTEYQNRIFQNKTLYLLSAGIINQRFYKEHYLSGFGITEDVPTGGYISVTGGIEEREFSKRWYSGFEAVYSRRVENAGYFSASFMFGGYKDQNKWLQNVYNFNLLYHSPLITKGNWKLRFLFDNNYLYGFNLFEGEQVYLDSQNGLRGFNRFALFGTKKITANAEALIFSPFAPLGFVIGGILFADFGVIGDRKNNLTSSKLYQGYGAGIRFNNESIARANFEVSLVYNPFTPVSSSADLKIIFTGKLIFGSRIISFDRPAVITINGRK